MPCCGSSLNLHSLWFFAQSPHSLITAPDCLTTDGLVVARCLSATMRQHGAQSPREWRPRPSQHAAGGAQTWGRQIERSLELSGASPLPCACTQQHGGRKLCLCAAGRGRRAARQHAEPLGGRGGVQRAPADARHRCTEPRPATSPAAAAAAAAARPPSTAGPPAAAPPPACPSPPPCPPMPVDMVCNLTLVDPSTNDHPELSAGVEMLCFAASAAELPRLHRPGDIIRLHRVKARLWEPGVAGCRHRVAQR